MTITLGELVEAEPALVTLTALPLPAAAAYHIAKLTRLVRIEAKHFHETRDRYIRECGTASTDKPDTFTIAPDSAAWATFVERVTELAAVPVELAYGPVTLAMLGAQLVAAKDLLALGPLFTESGE